MHVPFFNKERAEEIAVHLLFYWHKRHEEEDKRMQRSYAVFSSSAYNISAHIIDVTNCLKSRNLWTGAAEKIQ